MSRTIDTMIAEFRSASFNPSCYLHAFRKFAYLDQIGSPDTLGLKAAYGAQYLQPWLENKGHRMDSVDRS